MAARSIVVLRFVVVQKCRQQGKEMFPLSAENSLKDNISLPSTIGRFAALRVRQEMTHNGNPSPFGEAIVNHP